MKRKKRLLLQLLLFITSTTTEIVLINFFAPTQTMQFGTLMLPLLPVFFILLFLSIATIISMVLNSNRRGIFAGIFVVAYLLLRYFGFNHWFFVILLILIVALLELFFIKRK